MIKRNFTTLAALVPLAVLAACSGGGGSSTQTAPQFGPDDANVGDPTGGADVTYDRDADVVVLKYAGTTRVLTPDDRLVSTSPSNGTIRGFTDNGDTSDIVLLGRSASGRGEARVLTSQNLDIASGSVSRFGRTEMPVSGTATYSGDYMGLLTFDPGSDVELTVQGTVDLSVDFGRSQVSGKIRDRKNFIESFEYADVTIPNTPVKDGKFNTTISGGELIGEPGRCCSSVVGDGRVKGLFVGAKGGEVVGAVRIPHDVEGTLFNESGVFIAD